LSRTTIPTSAPFPYFGGKGRVAGPVWEALGDPDLYIEPFVGSAAVLLARPDDGPQRREIVNDADGFVSNFWRAVKRAPDRVADAADWPANEIDLLARHRWLCSSRRKRRFIERMQLDARYCCPRTAGYWAWAMSSWIGAGCCDSEWFGPGDPRNRGAACAATKKPNLMFQGLQSTGRRDNRRDVILALAARLRNATVLCGDWTRCFQRSQFTGRQTIGIFLDPPYAHSTGRDTGCYRSEKAENPDVERFCRELGGRAGTRIVLAGYDGEYRLPGWGVLAWSRPRTYAFQLPGSARRETRERLWLSPHCIPVDAPRANGGTTGTRLWRVRHATGRHRPRTATSIWRRGGLDLGLEPGSKAAVAGQPGNSRASGRSGEKAARVRRAARGASHLAKSRGKSD